MSMQDQLDQVHEELDDMKQQNQDLMDRLDDMDQQNADLADQLDGVEQELSDAISGKMDAVIGYLILILVLATLVVGVIVLVRKK